MIIEIALSKLLVGHFVTGIAKQNGNFNLTNTGHIKSEAVIKNLQVKGVQAVFVDIEKSKLDTSQATEKEKKSAKESKVLDDIKNAKDLFERSKLISKKVYQDASAGRRLDMAPVIDITNNTIDTIFTNPDALACIINIRKKDDYLLEHSVSVSVLMTLFSRFLKLDKKITHQLAVGAFLHDVGKIMIPDDILHKPGKLSETEFSVMKTHVNHSISIIRNTPGISDLSLEVAAMHHEKLDGQGYPFNVEGKDISRYGRMISICDIFDALTASRVYKDGFSHVKSFSILRKLAKDEHLDTNLVDSFIKCMGVYPVGSLVKLGSNKLAIVEGRNEQDPVNPQVRAFYSPEKSSFDTIENIDLANNDDFIKEEVKADDFDLDMNEILEFILMNG